MYVTQIITSGIAVLTDSINIFHLILILSKQGSFLFGVKNGTRHKINNQERHTA